MLSIATDISRLLHTQDKFETIAVKTASVGASVEAQKATRDISDGVYKAVAKVANYQPDGQNPFRFCLTIKKMAEVLEKNPPTMAMQTKIAAAVIVDEALCHSLQTQSDAQEQIKIAEQIAYGREYLSELLRGVL